MKHLVAAKICFAITFDNDQTIRGLLMAADPTYVSHVKYTRYNAEVLKVEYGDYIVYCVAGTDELKDWRDNLNLHIMSRWHHGFFEHYVKAAIDISPSDKDIYFAAHSLGGAVIQIVAEACSRRIKNIKEVVTFGAPRVAARKAQFEGIYYDTYHYVRAGDIVPSLPSKWRFKHIGKEIWIDHRYNIHVKPRWWTKLNSHIRERFFRGRSPLDSHNIQTYITTLKEAKKQC